MGFNSGFKGLMFPCFNEVLLTFKVFLFVVLRLKFPCLGVTFYFSVSLD